MKERIYTLDIFRILTVFFIFLFHSNIHLGSNYKILTPFISQSAIFMVAFFMVSGFSLYYSYYDRDLFCPNNLKIFYLKRLIRIYPLYIFIYILFLIFYNTLTLSQNIIIVPIELLLLQSFFNTLFNTLHNGGTWFLSCLFFCYLLFPWLKEILIQLKTQKIIIFCVLYLLTFLSPIIVKIFQISSLYSNPFFRLLEFIMGMLIADFALKNKNKIKKYTIFYIIIEVLILFIGVTFLKQNAFFKDDYTMYNIISVPIFAILIYNVSEVKIKPILLISSSSLVQYLSKISFAFYMAQFFTFKITKHLLTFSWFNNHTNSKTILTSLLINLLISILLYEMIEKPFKKILTKKLISNPLLKSHI